MREWADKDRLAEIDEALEAPNRWDATKRAPAWWHGEDDAWSDWSTAARV